MTLSIIYETHSLTEDNEAGIATGWLPGKLSAEGRVLARELGARRRDDGLSAVFVSDLARAAETANIAFAGSDIPVFLDWRLRECSYGDLNGCTVELLRGERGKHISFPFSGGESYDDVVARTRAVLADLTARFEGKRVLIISHSANKWALDVLLLGSRLEDLVDAGFPWREGWEYQVR